MNGIALSRKRLAEDGFEMEARPILRDETFERGTSKKNWNKWKRKPDSQKLVVRQEEASSDDASNSEKDVESEDKSIRGKLFQLEEFWKCLDLKGASHQWLHFLEQRYWC